jgi:uncharacterized protein (TIGR02099 family)
MIHILKSFAAKVWAGMLLLVIGVGLLVGAARLLLPLAAEYRGQLAEDLSRAMGVPVRVERLGARLAGLSPELRLGGVALLDPASGAAQLRFDEVRLRVGLLASWRTGMPVVEMATIVGARLLLRRQEDGGLLMLGFGGSGGRASDTQVSPALFFSEGRVRLLDSEIQWENRRRGLPPVRLSEVDASLVNAGTRHQLDMRARLGGVGGGNLELHADFFGDPASPLDWHGGLYLRGAQLQLDPLVRPLLPAELALDGEADLELWTQWRAGRPIDMDGSLVVRDPVLGAGMGVARVLDRVSGRLHWRRDGPDAWRLDLSELELVREGARRAPTLLALRVGRAADGGTLLRLGAGRLWIEDLAGIARVLPLGPRPHEALARLAPCGELRGLDLALHLPHEGTLLWRAAGGLYGLALEPWGDVPGVRGLDLAFRADQHHGVAQLASDGLELKFAELFRWPLEGRRLAGELAWRVPETGGLELESEELILDSDHLRTRSRLKLSIAADGSGPFIDMQTDFREGTGASATLYLPAGIMDPKLVQWLDRAIVSGQVTSGSFLVRGRAENFPFRDRSGRFQVLFGLQDGILDYQAGWPRLEEVLAEVLFQNEHLDIEVQEARLLDSRVHDARMRIPDLHHAPSIAVRGRVSGPFSDTFRVLRETPLAQSQAHYIRGMMGLGDSEVTLDLDIPLKPEGSFRVDGAVRWKGAGLVLQDWAIRLERLVGKLSFSDRGVSGRGIRALLFGDPLRLTVETPEGARGAPSRTLIDASMRLDPKHLQQAHPHRLWSLLRGSAAARVQLEIEHADPSAPELPLRYRLSSRLQGLAVDLPAPLGKEADQERALSIAGNWPPDPGLRLEADYGELRGALRLAPGPGGMLMAVAGELSFGGSGAIDLAREQFRVNGRLSHLDLGRWARWLAAQDIELSAGQEGKRREPAEWANLRVDELILPPLNLRDVRLSVARTPNAWELDLDCARLKGWLRLPDDWHTAGVSVTLERFDLDPEAVAFSTEPTAPQEWFEPGEMPPLYLSVNRLRLEGRDFGRLELKTAPMEDGLRLERVALDGPLLEVQGTGQWTGSGSHQSSRIELQIHSPDLGKALREMRFTSALGGADLDGSVALQWPAPPLDLRADNLQGELTFRLGAGRVLEVEPGVGRIFGLFNLGALNRRLALDFTDLFAKGYAFDSIDGRFSMAEGNAEAEEVVLRGPSANLEISGRTGLVTRDYDQVVTVTPKVSSALPLAGAIAGGPVVAVALLVAEKVMGEEVNKLIRFQYRVTGSWDAPDIQRIRTQDGWSLSNLLRPKGEAQRDEEAKPRETPPNPFLE